MKDSQKNVSAIILAGGSGNRFQEKKQFVILDGKELWKHSYDKICSLIDRNRVIVVGVDVPGGQTRTHSVINGMNSIPLDTDRVIIIEAARPLVTIDQLSLLINDEHPSVTYVKPCVNTVSFRDGRFINRNELYEMLTPQAFDFQLLHEALRSGRFQDVTDETRIMFEYHNIKPKFLETGNNLIKVTYPEDIEIVKCLMRQ